MKIKLLSNRVLVRRIEETQTTEGGIMIPISAREKPMEGIIVETGPGKMGTNYRLTLQVQTGDRVWFGKYAGVEVTINGEEFIVLLEEDILARIEE